jgi:hypothetical protein
MAIWRRFCALAGWSTTPWLDAIMGSSPSWSNGCVNVPPRCLFIVRQPEPGKPELVVCEDGRSRAYPLTQDQLLLMIAQAARVLANPAH